MQNSKVLSVVSILLILAALCANHAIARLHTATPHLLPVETLPRQIGEWNQVGEDRPIEPEVAKILPTARIVDRTYRNASGQTIDLLLLTASDYKDFHDPNVCLPGHGWQLSDRTTIQVQGQQVNRMRAVQQNNHLLVLYWLAGDYIAQIPHGRPMQKVLSLRKALTGEDGQSLFVRVMAEDETSTQESSLHFITVLQPFVNSLIRTSKSR